MDLSALLKQPPPDLAVVHAVGIPDAPDDPVGSQRIRLQRDGTLGLEWAHRSRAASIRGTVADAVVERVFVILRDGGFPHVAWVDFPPGPSFRSLGIERGSASLASVPMARRHYEGVEPWAELFRIFDSLCVQLRGPLPGFRNEIPPSATRT